MLLALGLHFRWQVGSCRVTWNITCLVCGWCRRLSLSLSPHHLSPETCFCLKGTGKGFPPSFHGSCRLSLGAGSSCPLAPPIPKGSGSGSPQGREPSGHGPSLLALAPQPPRAALSARPWESGVRGASPPAALAEILPLPKNPWVTAHPY